MLGNWFNQSGTVCARPARDAASLLGRFARIALVALGIAAVPSVARGDAAPHARLELASRASVRRLLLDGDFAAARTLLNQLLLVEDSAESRAAELELGFVLDVWSSGARPAANSPDAVRDIADPDVESAWEFAFIAAREVLVRGAFSEAARRFDRLVAHASNLVHAARASELRVLARDALSADAAKRSAPPPAARTAEAPARERKTRWYGKQILIVDGAALVTAPYVPYLGLATYVLGGPIVHLAHARPLPALGSLGARVALPAIGAVTPGLLVGCSRELGCFWEGAIGGVVGIALAVTLDAAVLAREPAPEKTKDARKSVWGPLSAGLTPRREGGLVFGLAATF